MLLLASLGLRPAVLRVFCAACGLLLASPALSSAFSLLDLWLAVLGFLKRFVLLILHAFSFVFERFRLLL